MTTIYKKIRKNSTLTSWGRTLSYHSTSFSEPVPALLTSSSPSLYSLLRPFQVQLVAFWTSFWGYLVSQIFFFCHWDNIPMCVWKTKGSKLYFGFWFQRFQVGWLALLFQSWCVMRRNTPVEGLSVSPCGGRKAQHDRKTPDQGVIPHGLLSGTYFP